MSSNRKLLKVISFVQVIVAIIVGILGAISLAGAGVAAEGVYNLFGIELDAVALATAMGVTFDVTAILSLICAFMGIRGANRPSSLGSHFLFCVLAVIAGFVSVAVSGNMGEFAAPTIVFVAIVVAIAAAFWDKRVRTELDR